jgi:hypothetical protein
MFAFCFTSVAAAQLRVREIRNSTRQTSPAVRAVRLGMTMLVLAVAGAAHAGSHGLGGMTLAGSSHNNGNIFSHVNQKFSQNNTNKAFNTNGSNNLNNKKNGQNNSTGIVIASNKTNGQSNSTGNTGNGKKNGQNNTTGNGSSGNKTNGQNTTGTTGNGNNSNSANKPTGNNSNSAGKPIGTNTANTANTGKNNMTNGGSGSMKTGKMSGMSSMKKGSGNFCKPCHKCSYWYCWSYPHWCPLYSCDCGCYDDVPVVEIAQGLDLQLLAVRSIDAGDPENNQGPAFRVWFRNNSNVAIDHPFNVLALAAHDANPTADLPQAGARVDSIDAGQTASVDIRLPAEANQPGLPMLHVLVDSHREIPEVNEANNGLVINRGEVLPVDAGQPDISGQPSVTPSNVTPTPGNVTPTPSNITPKTDDMPPAPVTDGSSDSPNNTPDLTEGTAANVPLMLRGVAAN